MSRLYRLQFPDGLLLDPNKGVATQLNKLGVVLPGSAQIRLARYMNKTKAALGAEFNKPQLFYLLEEYVELPHKPKPLKNRMSQMYFSLADVLRLRQI